MIDLAKVADLVCATLNLTPCCIQIDLFCSVNYTLSYSLFLFSNEYILQVLLLVDASFGFEMEVFEFLNICQVHGFPKIMGVLTHLDMFRQNKQLRKTKKKLKHRFWTEVYQVK